MRLLPDDRDGYPLLAGALIRAGKYTDAVSVYRKALRLMPDSPELRFYLANLLRKLEDSTERGR